MRRAEAEVAAEPDPRSVLLSFVGLADTFVLGPLALEAPDTALISGIAAMSRETTAALGTKLLDFPYKLR